MRNSDSRRQRLTPQKYGRDPPYDTSKIDFVDGRSQPMALNVVVIAVVVVVVVVAVVVAVVSLLLLLLLLSLAFCFCGWSVEEQGSGETGKSRWKK